MKTGRVLAIIGVMSAIAISLSACGSSNKGVDISQIKQGNQKMGVSVHDPSIFKDNGTYYIFGSHMDAAKSSDLQTFKSFATGVNSRNKLFDNLFDNPEEGAFRFVGEYEAGGYAVWAPDVVYNEKLGKYVMYFSVSHDYRTSSICYATADAAEGPYHFEDVLISSGFTMKTADKTNIYDVLGEDVKLTKYLTGGKYNNLNYPNCIDPTVFRDENDKMWMVYGSWSGGIFLLEIDENTGRVIFPEADEENKVDPYYGRYLIGGLHNSCEGPYMIYDKDSGYYYLFVSYGALQRTGGYQIRLFRAENLFGPYVDASGETFGYVAEHSAYGVKMMGNYRLPSLKTAYMAPGHNSALIDDDGKYYLVYHQRFDNGSEYHEPRVHQMFLNEDGWFVTAPFATNGEALSEAGLSKVKDIAGTYYMVNHGTDISNGIHAPQEVEISNKGGLTSQKGLKGTVTVKQGTNYVDISIGDVVYKGVVGEMVDEAGNNVRFITTCGNNNESLWFVMYI